MKKRVLIVDDVKFSRVILKDVLEQENFEVIGEATDGKKALKIIDELNPDIITLDITMPQMNGLELMEVLKERGYKGKIIVVSSTGQSTSEAEALKLGAVDYVSKPFERERLITALKLC